MEAILRCEKLQSLVESKQAPIAYPITIGMIFLNMEKLDLEKQRSKSGLILSTVDNLIGIVVGK